MKERLVRGTNVEHVVRILRASEEQGTLPDLGQPEQDVLRKRVSRSTWYTLSLYDSLLQTVHRYVYDGSEVAAQNIGRLFARNMIAENAELMLVPGAPIESLSRMNARWREHFNFGEISIKPLDGTTELRGVRVRLTGYPDMSACHGHIIIGWSAELAESSGVSRTTVRIEERPWMHNSVLTYVLNWD